jgi:hypothetical protein
MKHRVQLRRRINQALYGIARLHPPFQTAS